MPGQHEADHALKSEDGVAPSFFGSDGVRGLQLGREVWHVGPANVPGDSLAQKAPESSGAWFRDALRKALSLLPGRIDLAAALAVAVAYFTGAELAFLVGTVSNLFAPLWPPNVVLLCALVMAPYRVWWLYLAAALPAHVLAETGAGMAAPEWIGAFLCNVAFATIAAHGLRVFIGGPPWLGGLARVAKYIVIAAIAGPGVVALSIAASGWISRGEFGGDMFAVRWFLSNLTAALTLGPLLLVWIADGDDWLHDLSARRLAEAMLVTAAVTVGAYLSFAATAQMARFPAMSAIAIPPIIWAATQFGMRGASGALCITSLLAIAGSIRGVGPFVLASADDTVLSLQTFFAIMAVPFLILAGVINERREALAKAMQAERNLEAILDNTLACIAIRDMSGRYVLANRKSQQRMPKDYIGKHPHQIFSETIANVFCADDATAVASLDPVTKEEVVHFHEGPRSYLSTKFALRDAENKPYAFCTIATDVTDIKRSTEALEESEAKFRVMAETVPAILFTADRDGQWDYANQRFFDLAGIPATVATMPNWADFIHPDDIRRVRQAWQHSVTVGESFEEELRIRSAMGRYYWFVARCRPIRNTNGRIERWFGAAVDIDDLKQAENELRVANATQSTILASVSDHYYTLDDRMHVTAMNPNAAKAAGIDASEGIGRHLLDVCPQLRNTNLIPTCWRALSRRGPSHLEIQYNAPFESPSERLLDVNIYPLDKGGLSVFSRDISERKTTERMLHDLSNRLLRSQDEERRRIARELHDGTAQNLGAVMLNLRRLATRAAALDKDAPGILDESLQLIDQSLSEIRTMSYWLHPPLLDEGGLVPAVKWYVEGLMKRDTIKIELQLSLGSTRLDADVEMSLFRVIQESLGNVIRHSRADAAVIRLLTTPSKTVLVVSDNGQGMGGSQTVYSGNDVNSLGVGITGMSARLKQLGGRLDIKSSQRGTMVRAVVPSRVEAS